MTTASRHTLPVRLRITSIVVLVAAVIATDSSLLRAGQTPESTARTARPTALASHAPDAAQTVQTYCAGCHDGVMRSASGGVLERFDTARFANDRDVWSRAYRQLQAGTMPPFGAARPDRPTAEALLTAIETGLGAGAPPRAAANDQQIAERLALMLWNGAPDDVLAEEANRHRLTQPATLERQVQRMLADDRAEAFVSRFFFPWLGLDKLANAEPDAAAFPDYVVSLRDAMATETRLFIRSQLREDRDPLALWSADYTFLNEQLARHYGMAGVSGAEFRRVSLPMPERAGLLGQGSILMVTSRHQAGKPAYTSPAARSTWIRLHFLGAPAPNPAPNAQPVKPELPITPQTRTLPAQPCLNCHRNFFPLGYALENFDPIGRWRTQDQIGPVDASGEYVDGSPTNGIVQLRSVLLRYPDAFRTNITEKLLLYSAGAPLARPRVTADTLTRARQVLRATPSPRWSSLIAAIVRMTADESPVVQ